MKKRILAVLVNYGHEQLNYLEKVVNSLNSFKKYDITIVVHSNILLHEINGIDKVTLFEKPTGAFVHDRRANDQPAEEL